VQTAENRDGGPDNGPFGGQDGRAPGNKRDDNMDRLWMLPENPAGESL